MTDAIDFKKSIKNSKIKLSRNDFLVKYMLVFMLIILCIPAFIGLSFRYDMFFLILSILILSLLVLTPIAILINDKLVETRINRSSSEIRILITKEIEKLGWRIHRSNNDYLIADKPGKWLAGKQIAILFYKKSMFINVQNLPGNGGYFPFSFGRNKKIRKVLIRLIDQTLSLPSSY